MTLLIVVLSVALAANVALAAWKENPLRWFSVLSSVVIAAGLVVMAV